MRIVPTGLVIPLVLAAAPGARGSSTSGDPALLPAVARYLEARASEIDLIPPDRKKALTKLALYVKSRRAAGQPARLTFICTHNSRRSHMAALWSRAAATRFGLDGVETYSGGTEATAFNPRAVAALERAGLDIERKTGGDNPRYAVRYARDVEPAVTYSKVYDAEGNPDSDFVAVMTCSQADENCPVVDGASLRIAIPYEDPKAFDGTDREAKTDDERSEQIAREMLFLFANAKG